MRTTGISALCALAIACLVGVLAGAWEADFDPSTYNPEVSEVVNLAVCTSCLDGAAAQYRWDFDGDGVAEIETQDPVITRAFGTPGFHAVTLTVVVAGGRTSARTKGVWVGATPALAVRELVPQPGGTTMVLITIAVHGASSAIGLEETMPRGWQVEVIDAGGSIFYANPETRMLEVLWGNAFRPGDILAFSYELHPSYATGLPKLTGRLSGYADGQRFVVDICGELAVSR